jgi:hypothetical protein
MFLWFPVLDLARAPRRAARKKGSGYENDSDIPRHFKLPEGIPAWTQALTLFAPRILIKYEI